MRRPREQTRRRWRAGNRVGRAYRRGSSRRLHRRRSQPHIHYIICILVSNWLYLGVQREEASAFTYPRRRRTARIPANFFLRTVEEPDAPMLPSLVRPVSRRNRWSYIRKSKSGNSQAGSTIFPDNRLVRRLRGRSHSPKGT